MALTVPTWIAAVATAGLAVAVVVAAGLARRAVAALLGELTAQHEVTARLAQVLDLQSQALRTALDERRRAQACQVFIELDRTGAPAQDGCRVTATVHNGSELPVYDLYVIWQLGTTRMGKPDPAARLLPGREVTFERAPEPDSGGALGEADTLTAFLTFRDSAGVRWTVREDGTVSDISPAPNVRGGQD
jgi:hypothetical protein